MVLPVGDVKAGVLHGEVEAILDGQLLVLTCHLLVLASLLLNLEILVIWRVFKAELFSNWVTRQRGMSHLLEWCVGC